MPPKPKRDVCVILFDINVSEDFFAQAKQCIDDLYSVRCTTDNQVLIKFYVINCNETKNAFPKSMWYTGIYQSSDDFVIPKPTLPSQYLNKAFLEPGSCNVIKAIELAVIDIEEMSAKINIRCAQIIVLTDFSNFTKEESLLTDNLLEKIRELQVFIYLLVPNMMPKYTLKNYSDVAKWGKFSEDNRVGLENATYLNNSSFKSVKKLTSRVDYAVFCDVKIGLYIVNFYKLWTMPQPFAMPLSVEENYALPVLSFRSLKKPDKLKIRKKFERNEWIYVKESDPTEKVNFYDVVRCYLTHDTLVVLTDDVAKAMFKNQGQREFKLMGFVDASLIPEWLLCGDGSSLVMAKNLGTKQDRLIRTLLQAMVDKNKYAIVRRRYIQNTKSKYYVLLPRLDSNALVMTQIPFANNIIGRYEETPIKKKDLQDIDSPLQTPIDEYLDQLDVTVPNADGATKFPLTFAMMHNPQVLKTARNVLYKLEGEEMNAKENWFGLKVEFPPKLKQFWPVAETTVT